MLKIKILSRKSKLAVTQTEYIAKLIRDISSDTNNGNKIDTELLFSDSLGDKYRDNWDKYLASFESEEERVINNKKKWIYELEQAVINKECSLALHSAKDIPNTIAEGTKLLAVGERENYLDVLIINKKVLKENLKDLKDLRDLPLKIGSNSLRRKEYLKRISDNWEVSPLSGNVDTRLKKVSEAKNYDAIILAFAGLSRLQYLKKNNYIEVSDDSIFNISNLQKLDEHNYFLVFPSSIILPAAGQGVLVAQYNKEDMEIEQILQKISSTSLSWSFNAERQMLDLLKADCSDAIGILASENILNNKKYRKIELYIASQKNNNYLYLELTKDIDNSEHLVQEIYEQAILKGAKELLAN